MGLAGQMIEFRRVNLVDDSPDRGRIRQVCIVQKQSLFIGAGIAIELVQTGSFQRTAATHDAVDFVAFFQQQFREQGTILTCNTGDECEHSGGRKVESGKQSFATVGAAKRKTQFFTTEGTEEKNARPLGVLPVVRGDTLICSVATRTASLQPLLNLRLHCGYFTATFSEKWRMSSVSLMSKRWLSSSPASATGKPGRT